MNKYNILIADDEEIDRVVLSKLIRDKFDSVGEIFLATNGEELVSIAKNNHIDILIVDIEMPVLSGIDAVRELRKNHISIKVIVNTAYNEFEYAVEALKLEADDFIVKPLVRSRLVEAIEKCMIKIEDEEKNLETQRAMIEALETATIKGSIKIEKNEEIFGDEDVRKYVNQARRYIFENYMKDFSLEMIADSIGISSFYLSRVFKKEMDINLNDYITDVRVEKAKELMSKKNYSIRELSEKCGYNNHTYFCKIFKNRTGMTIGEYKESLKTSRR